MPRSTDLPKDQGELDELLEQLAPELDRQVYRQGRRVSDPQDAHQLFLLPAEDGGWRYREIFETGRSTYYGATKRLRSVADLAHLLGRTIGLDLEADDDPVARLRDRAAVYVATREHAAHEAEREATRETERRTQDAFDTAVRLAEVGAGGPYAPREGWQIALSTEVGEVAVWGPPLVADPRLEVRSVPPTEPGWYAVLVNHVGLVVEWAELVCGPCSLESVVDGLRPTEVGDA